VVSPGLAFVGRVQHFADVLEILHEIIASDVVSLQPLNDRFQSDHRKQRAYMAYIRIISGTGSLFVTW